MANEAPKKFSDELRALRAEFNDLAEKTKKTLAALDSAIWKQELKEIREGHDAVVTQFAVPGALESVNNRDVTILIAKSKDMGHGANSNLGQAIDAAAQLLRVTRGNYDLNVSGLTIEGASTRGLNLADSDRLDKAREKTETLEKQLVPALREVMVANTPDKVGDRNKHYIIVTDGNATDSTEHAVQMIEATLLYNKKATFDFITVGAGGNVGEIAQKTSHALAADRVSFHKVEKAEEIWGALAGALKNRIAASPYVKPAPAPEAPKNATATPTP